VREIDHRMYAVAFCTQCQVDIPFWTPAVEQLIGALNRAHLLRDIARRLCAVATGAEPEIRTALTGPVTPAQLGAHECEVTGGVLSRASVELRFSEVAMRRDDLDIVFGTPAVLPRTGPGAAHHLAYDVRVNGAPACVAMFASFAEQPQAKSGVKRILLRIDPA
jgi:hypothetical protein